MTALHYQSLAGVCRRLKSGELSAVAVTEHLLQRIEALEPSLHSFAMVLPEWALERARRLDRARADGEPLGPLHGVPIAVKDLLYTRGLATASGTRVLRDFVPQEDATVVARLEAAGAILIGKTQLTEGAFGAHHPDIAVPVNPWQTDYWSGVSSSGSGVAVAAGLAYGALGTDTGGSIRFPSACNGLVGLKPTYGRVSRFGAFPLAESLDHIGPMTRTVEDAARLLQVIAGFDARDPTSLEALVPNYAAELGASVAGLRIGVDWSYVGDGVAEEVVETVREALERLTSLGCRVVETPMPPDCRTLAERWAVTCGMECAHAHASWFPARRADYGEVLAGLIDFGRSASRQEYQALEERRLRFRAALNESLQSVDLLISPCMVTPTPATAALDGGEYDDHADFLTFTAPFDYSGHPTLTLPAGLAEDGLPRSFQLIGPLLGEALLLRVGSGFEASLAFDAHPLP